MKQKTKKLFAAGMIAAFLLSGCGGGEQVESSAFPVEVYTESHEVEGVQNEQMHPAAGTPVLSSAILAAEASGIVIYEGNGVTIDASNTIDGYVMIRCNNGSDVKKKIILQGPKGIQYTYDVNLPGEYETFGFSDGNGNYMIGVYENVEGSKYTTLFTQMVEVKMKDEFAPFLCPNQYVNYREESEALKLAVQLTANKTNDLEKVQEVYHYVVENITYDKEEAQTVQSGYLPDVDEVLETKKGICFDYAALMTAMLRSQNIPTKLVTGYTGSAYHAWISTYTPETGWVEGIIFFDGVSWKLMDPTFASSGDSSDAIMEYIGDGENYKEKYIY